MTLVNIRAGQDSGFFFLQPTLEALTYAGDIGVDVVNMSFYTDPWLYNCLANPADSPAEQAEQRVIRQATQRALNYAPRHGVLPVAAMGNEATDLGNPTVDDTSPDYPAGRREDPHGRQLLHHRADRDARRVVGQRDRHRARARPYYSNYGTEQTDVAAPGGDAYDTPDETAGPAQPRARRLPEDVAEAQRRARTRTAPRTTPFVVRDCTGADLRVLPVPAGHLDGRHRTPSAWPR